MSIAIGSAQSGAAIPSRFTCISRHVRKSASMCASLEPDRFAVFGYAHVPWFKKHQRAIDETRLPGGQERLDQAEAARSTLIDYGYAPIGIDRHIVRATPRGRPYVRNIAACFDDCQEKREQRYSRVV